jgi:SMP-30/Gluconolactonase/LRE-like region
MRTAPALMIAAAMTASAAASQATAQRAAGASQICGTQGPVQVFCGPSRSEDLVAIPKTPWIVASAIGGGVHLIDARAKTSVQLYPSPTAKERLDKTRYPTCQAPPDAAEKASFTTLGLSLRVGAQGFHTLYAIRYPTVSRVEVFELDVRGEQPSVTWIGCVEAPADTILLNSMVPLRDGGFVATHFYERGPNAAAARERAVAGELTGWLLRWHARTGWSKIAGSDTSGPNGVEISTDGKWMYVSEWGRSAFYRTRLNGDASKRESLHLEFRPDNVHWAPDGMLLVGGATDTDSRVVKINPRTFKVTELVRLPDDAAQFFHASVAAQFDNELWLGSARANRIAIYPLAPAR